MDAAEMHDDSPAAGPQNPYSAALAWLAGVLLVAALALIFSARPTRGSETWDLHLLDIGLAAAGLALLVGALRLAVSAVGRSLRPPE
jgi:hypothetical protein